MNTKDDATLLFRIAKYYYIDNLSQIEISKIENISRPQVSRFLKKARDTGIVKITVSLPENSKTCELAKKVQSKLNLKNVIVLPSHPNDSYEKILVNIASMAVDYIVSQIKDCKYVGIGWGETLYNISLQLSYQAAVEDLTFVPIIGNSGTNNPFLQINNIVERFSEKFHAKRYYNNSLVLVEKQDLSNIEKQRLLELEKIWCHLDAVVLGLGGKMESSKIYIDEMPKECDIEKMRKEVIGDIIANFFKEDGCLYQLPINFKLVSLSLERLKEISNVICIAYGLNKVKAINYVAKNKYIKTLITDSVTAKAILED